MKKSYISPEMEIVKMEMQQVIAASYNSTPVSAGDVDAPELDDVSF